MVEIWPGAGGWYTEVLAPILQGTGKLYAAQIAPDASNPNVADDSRDLREENRRESGYLRQDDA